MTEGKTRRGRSNSLQRMLELEKLFMLERQRQPPASPQKASLPPVVHQHAHTSKNSQNGLGHQAAVKVVSSAPQLPPLKIHIPLSNSNPIETVPRGRRTTRSNTLENMTPVSASTQKAATPKTVAFNMPGDRKGDKESVCISPSWEAYERRKKEKKQDKQDKKEQDLAAKAESKAKTRRLSKPPPTSSPQALKLASQNSSEIALPTTRQVPQRKRPSSLLGFPIADKAEPSSQKPRSRSSSFTSLLRSPFESRRLSMDLSPTRDDGGFIGGIKLEIQKHEVYQQALDAQIIASEADIHPALRQSRPSQAWSTPVSLSPRSLADPQRRAYPPITRQKYPPKPQVLTAPATLPPSDIGKIEKWRARVGLKPAHRRDQSTSREESRVESTVDTTSEALQSPKTLEVRRAEGVQTVIAAPQPQPQAAVIRHGSKTSQSSDLSHYTNASMDPSSKPISQGRLRSPVKSDQLSVDASSHGIPRKSLSKQALANKQDDSSCREHPKSEMVSQHQSSTDFHAPPSPPPPEPPRRSSKRNSVLSFGGSTFCLPSHDDIPVPPLPNKAQICHDYLSSLQDPDGSSRPSSIQCSPKLAPRLHMSSSSEDSCSDQLHSPSFPSTPDTSRPQSEKDFPPLFNDDGKSFMLDNDSTAKHAAQWPFGVSQQTSTVVLEASDSRNYMSLEYSDDPDVDPIQAAAEKVLEAYSQIPVGCPSIRQQRSDLSLQENSTLPLRLNKGRATDPANGSKPAGIAATSGPLPRRFPLVTKRKSTPLVPAAESTAKVSHYPMAAPSMPAGVGKPIGKRFVECCGCKYYHDMPNNLYEAMENPEKVLSPCDYREFAGALSMTVKCPWCKHEMSTKCCAGFLATVHVQERLH